MKKYLVIFLILRATIFLGCSGASDDLSYNNVEFSNQNNEDANKGELTGSETTLIEQTQEELANANEDIISGQLDKTDLEGEILSIIESNHLINKDGIITMPTEPTPGIVKFQKTTQEKIETKMPSGKNDASYIVFDDVEIEKYDVCLISIDDKKELYCVSPKQISELFNIEYPLDKKLALNLKINLKFYYTLINPQTSKFGNEKRTVIREWRFPLLIINADNQAFISFKMLAGGKRNLGKIFATTISMETKIGDIPVIVLHQENIDFLGEDVEADTQIDLWRDPEEATYIGDEDILPINAYRVEIEVNKTEGEINTPSIEADDNMNQLMEVIMSDSSKEKPLY